MAKDKSKSSKPLFEDPFGELDDTDKASDAPVKPKSGSRKRHSSKTSEKPKAKNTTGATGMSSTTSRKRTTKKTTVKSQTEKKTDSKKRAEKKTASKPETEEKTPSPKKVAKKSVAKPEVEKKTTTSSKPRTSSRKRVVKKTTMKPKPEKKTTSSAKSSVSSRKRSAKKSKVKSKAEKKATASAKPKTTPRKRTVKMTAAKHKPETEAKTELKPEIPSPEVIDERKNELEIVDQATLGEEITVEIDQEVLQTSETTPTLLETLFTSLEEGDKDDDRRALAALPFIRQVEQFEGEQHIVFLLAETEYAMHIENVLEIGESLSTTTVPNVPEWVMGVANLRGDIVSVIDLRIFMGLPPRSQGEKTRTLIIQSRDREFSTCFLIDEVCGIRYLDMEQISDHAFPDTDIMAQYVDGFYEHEGQRLVVLDVERLLLSKRMQAF